MKSELFTSRILTNVAPAARHPAYRQAALGERTSLLKNSEFVSLNNAAELKHQQTFDIILPSLIHKSEKGNLS
jgi:hypothetical protein